MMSNSNWTLPAITKGIIILNVAIHVIIFLTTFNIGEVSISGQQVLLRGEYYRLFTNAFTHVGLLHIAMNMSTMLQLGTSLEMQFGSLPFLFLSIWGVLVIGFLYVGISYLMWKISGSFHFMQTSAVGYSGVLFMYAIMEAFHTRIENQSFFGMCVVPARMYPFVLMMVIQFVMPGISFLGHLCGVIMGLLTVYGISEKIFLPSLEFCQNLECKPLLGCLVNANGYVRCGDLSNSFKVQNGSESVLSSLWGALVMVWGYIVNIVSTILYILGCPVERMSLQLSSLCASIKGFCSPIFGSSSAEADRPTTSSNVLGGTPRYARVEQTETV